MSKRNPIELHQYLTSKANRVINEIIREIIPSIDLDPDNVEKLKRDISRIVDREIMTYFTEEEGDRETVPESYLVASFRYIANQERKRNPYLATELENIVFGLEK